MKKIEEKLISEIKQEFSTIESMDDLLILLNNVNKILCEDSCDQFSIQQLNFYANPLICKNRYKTFSILKKSGGIRQINTPTEKLKTILHVFNFILQCCYIPHNAAHGFVQKKSIVSNAKIHVGNNYVYNIDLKDFFHSFDRNRVKLALMHPPFNLNDKRESIAFLLACLFTHPLEIEGKLKTVLPQGSPTSPNLTNILCQTLDRRLNGFAKKIGAKYSRYADDITFSSKKNVFKLAMFNRELKRIIEENQDLHINNKKTRLQVKQHRQEVTGLTVNEKVNVTKRYVKRIRMWIYYWEKYGYNRAQQLFRNDYKKDKGHVYKIQPNLTNVLNGKLEFLKMVKGDKDPTYLRLKVRYEKLIGIKPDHSEIVLNTLLTKGLSQGMKEFRKFKNL